MNTLKVVNIKCGGCEKSIISGLEELGVKEVKVDVANQTVSFDGDIDAAKTKLAQMGYPEAGSEEAKKFIKKAKSYLSCMIGRTQKDK